MIAVRGRPSILGEQDDVDDDTRMARRRHVATVFARIHRRQLLRERIVFGYLDLGGEA